MRATTTIPIRAIVVLFLSVLIGVAGAFAGDQSFATGTDNELIALFRELRALQRLSTPDGVPDYSAKTLEKIRIQLKEIQIRFAAIDTSGWTLDKRVDYELVRAEMNGLDFDLRVLQPWARDPAYYAVVWTEQSDTPSHEGPVCPAAIELWTYSFPLSKEDAARLTAQLRIIPPLLEQARANLTGHARDLWIAGIKNIRDQVIDLENLGERTESTGNAFKTALEEAKSASSRFAGWLEQQAPSRTGPSGIGKDNYNWYLRHVLLVPMTWDDEVALLKRELGRAYTSLELERHRNRGLPPATAVSSPEEYSQLAERSVKKLMDFLRKHEIMTVRDYMEPELRKHLGGFIPEERRNFFYKIMHLDPTPLYSHGIHWFDIAQQDHAPHASPIRREPLSYNIWMSRAEGLTTSAEEMFMHAGLYDDNPRSRELVWIMLAQRCARGLASLYAHANEITLEQARAYQVEWTPAGWTGDVSLVGFEQHLYLRQPAYGPSYVTGKHLLDRLIMDRSRQLGDRFRLREFFDQMYAMSTIPVSLIRLQMTGRDDEMNDRVILHPHLHLLVTEGGMGHVPDVDGRGRRFRADRKKAFPVPKGRMRGIAAWPYAMEK